MDTNQKKRLVIVGEVLLGTLVAVVVLIIIFKSSGSAQCEPLKEIPQLDVHGLKNIPSHDNKTLVGLAAYLRFTHPQANGQDNQLTFTPIDFNNVTVTPGKNGGQEMALKSTCSKATFKLHRSGKIIEIKSIQVDPESDSETKSCSTGPTGIYYGQDDSYICYSKQVLPCYELIKSETGLEILSDVKVADFVVDVLRFEVNGDPKQISAGNFSKPPHFCF